MLLRVHPSSSVPVYVQLVEQIKHAIETGALRPGEQLPAIRRLAEEVVVNPNTVAKAYRELERERVIETRQGTGAFVASRWAAGARLEDVREAGGLVAALLTKLRSLGLDESEMRRTFEAELQRIRDASERRAGKRRRPS